MKHVYDGVRSKIVNAFAQSNLTIDNAKKMPLEHIKKLPGMTNTLFALYSLGMHEHISCIKHNR